MPFKPEEWRRIQEAIRAATSIPESTRRALQGVLQNPDLERALEGIRTGLAGLGQQISFDVPADVIEQFRRFDGQLIDFAKRAATLLDDSVADNWPDGEWSEVIECVEATGLALVWVPREQVVVELLREADDAGWNLVLLNHRDDIIDDCRSCLDAVDVNAWDDPEESRTVADQVGALRDACDALGARLSRPAQTTAGSVITTALQHIVGYKVMKARRELERHSLHEMPVVLIRWAVTAYALRCALDTYQPENGDPIPTRFNRHATAHSLGGVQFTDANAIAGVMLATSLMRELTELKARGVDPWDLD
jgi:hypothetical protein